MNAPYKIHAGVYEGLDNLEQWISILRPISKNGAPVVHPIAVKTGSGPKTVVLFLSFTVGPGGFRADFPLEVIQSVLPRFYALGLRRICCFVYSYDPQFDLEGRGLLSAEQMERLQGICDDEFMDCDGDLALTVGYWVDAHVLHVHRYIDLDDSLLDPLMRARDANEFLNLIQVQYAADWLDVRLEQEPELRGVVAQLKGFDFLPTRFF
jgi:hypothetical protein